MNEILLTAMLGIAVGIIDILPMTKMKLDAYSIGSAFVFYYILPFVIVNIDLYGLPWWGKGIIGLFLALPTIFIVAKEDKKSAVPMMIMSFVLGTLIGIVQHYVL